MQKKGEVRQVGGVDEAEIQVALRVRQPRDIVNVLDDFQPKHADERERDEQFDEEISDRKRCLAGAATAAQNPVADDGNVVVESNRLEATAATGTGPEHALLIGQPGDEHVEHAAEHRPENERDNAEVHHRAPVEEEVQHAAKISAAICSGERPLVSTVKSATDLYSGSRSRIKSSISARPPLTRLGRRSAVVGSA